MAKTCKNCGNELNDNVRFCPKCGTKCETPVEVKKESQEATLETNTAANEIPMENSQVEMKTEPDNVSGKKSPKWKKWVEIAIVVVVIYKILGLLGCGGNANEVPEETLKSIAYQEMSKLFQYSFLPGSAEIYEVLEHDGVKTYFMTGSGSAQNGFGAWKNYELAVIFENVLPDEEDETIYNYKPVMCDVCEYTTPESMLDTWIENYNEENTEK